MRSEQDMRTGKLIIPTKTRTLDRGRDRNAVEGDGFVLERRSANPADPDRWIIEQRRLIIRVSLKDDQVDDMRHREADEFVLEDRPAGERDRDVGFVEVAVRRDVTDADREWLIGDPGARDRFLAIAESIGSKFTSVEAETRTQTTCQPVTALPVASVTEEVGALWEGWIGAGIPCPEGNLVEVHHPAAVLLPVIQNRFQSGALDRSVRALV